MSGTLPHELTNLTNLGSFKLSNNNFTGYLPPDVCKGGALPHFNVENNNFVGPIPRSLKNCTSLVWAILEKNHIIGNISQDFRVYPHLTYIDLSYNQWKSLLIGQTVETWRSLKIAWNKLTKKIPLEFLDSLQLQLLEVSSNQLGGLHSLFNLNLSNNLFGQIHVEIGKLFNLYTLDLFDNYLIGIILLTLGNCLMLMNLSRNELKGSIPY